MTRGFTYSAVVRLALAVGFVFSVPAQAQTASQSPYTGDTQGVACSPNGALALGNSFVSCASGAWSVQPITIGTASSAPYACDSTYEGMLYFDTGATAVKYCNGSSWVLTSTGAVTVNAATQYQIAYLSSSTAISGDSNITTDSSNDLIVSGGNLAIGTTTVSGAISISGEAAQKRLACSRRRPPARRAIT